MFFFCGVLFFGSVGYWMHVSFCVGAGTKDGALEFEGGACSEGVLISLSCGRGRQEDDGVGGPSFSIPILVSVRSGAGGVVRRAFLSEAEGFFHAPGQLLSHPSLLV